MPENAAIASVCARLEALVCQVTQRLTTTQHDVEILAHNYKHEQQCFDYIQKGPYQR